jgi:osmotically-inducible protein OsmY
MNATIHISPVDHDLEQRIRSFFAGRNYPALQNLDINVQQGTVVISGNVDTFYEKQLATNCCQRVAGVLHVFNHVAVRHHDLGGEPLPRSQANARLSRRK